MPMTQDMIRQHYEGTWRTKSDSAADVSQMAYSNPVEDAILYPIYVRMLSDFGVQVTNGDVLDVGAGSGRWIRFFLEHFRPTSLTGVDYTQASVDLLGKWFAPHSAGEVALSFSLADITSPTLDLGRQFDLINIANVLFHIPEQDKFQYALANLAKHLKPGGVIATTEYLPRTSMRTEWMLVRDRYVFEAMIQHAGLTIAGIRPFAIFTNDPMGLDGPDSGTRGHFQQVRHLLQTLSNSVKGADGQAFLLQAYAEIERAVLSFCKERVADVDMPSQKLVFLRKAH